MEYAPFKQKTNLMFGEVRTLNLHCGIEVAKQFDFHEFVHGKVFLRQLRIEQITHQETVSFVSLRFMIKGNKYQLFPSRPVIK